MTPPVFRELTREGCEALLAVSHVGRLAYTFHDRVDIEPIHYVYADGWIGSGAKAVLLLCVTVITDNAVLFLSIGLALKTLAQTS